MTTLDTDRLRLRPLEARDGDALALHQSSPEVMRYVPGGARSRAVVSALIERSQADWKARGFGLFAVEHKEIDELIGYAGLKPLEQGPEIEIDMILAEAHWTQGLGTEAALAVLRFGRESAGLARIVAVPHDANVAAHRVCEHCEMSPAGTVRHYGIECAVYSSS